MNKNSLFLSLSAVLLLAGCASSDYSNEDRSAIYSSNEYLPKTKAIPRSTEASLAAANKAGDKQEALAILQKIYVDNPKDPVVAVRYGRLLREDDQIKAAEKVLQPYTGGKNANDLALTEMAMTQIALGNFPAAQTYAEKALKLNDKNARSHLALGTALDAQKEHQKAEVAFRNGMKHWKGDPTPIMNNLALNLASQGHLQEALSLIEKALDKNPNRLDLERNRRIIATLLESTGPRAPAPAKKPTS
ncbi:MAG: tetratricopeptide repeat protein [Pseudomonadota bacterium]